jgi:hypothetical protein
VRPATAGFSRRPLALGARRDRPRGTGIALTAARRGGPCRTRTAMGAGLGGALAPRPGRPGRQAVRARRSGGSARAPPETRGEHGEERRFLAVGIPDILEPQKTQESPKFAPKLARRQTAAPKVAAEPAPAAEPPAPAEELGRLGEAITVLAKERVRQRRRTGDGRLCLGAGCEKGDVERATCLQLRRSRRAAVKTAQDLRTASLAAGSELPSDLLSSWGWGSREAGLTRGSDEGGNPHHCRAPLSSKAMSGRSWIPQRSLALCHLGGLQHRV